MSTLEQIKGIDFGILQGAAEQAIRALEQTEQQVLDQNLAAATYHTALGRKFQIVLGGGVEGLYQLLQIDVDHYSLFP